MKKLALITVAAVVLIATGGSIFLASWNIPAPSAKIERPVADDRMPK